MQCLRIDLRPSRVADLVSVCRRTAMDTVMLFTGGPQWYSRPQTIQQAHLWVAQMEPAVHALRAERLGIAINVWATLGHGTGDTWLKDSPWQPQVGSDGHPIWDVVCPLDRGWQQYVEDLYAWYASLSPDWIWIDDDFRHHHHPPADWTCFCPLHIAAVGQVLQRSLTLEDILRAVFVEQDASVISAWRLALNDGITQLARRLARRVHAVSPATRWGLMSSPPELHGFEGRHWIKLLDALSVAATAAVRPTLGNYSGGDARDVIGGTLLAVRTMQHVGEHPPYPEIESYPFGAWNKSARYLRLQILASAAYGMNELTFDIFPYGGRTELRDPAIESVLRHTLAHLQAQKTSVITHASWELRGIGVPVLQWPEGLRYPGVEPRLWDMPLSLLGFGLQFDAQSPVVALHEGLVATWPEDRLRHHFSHGVLMDAAAARTLFHRGLGSWIRCGIGHSYRLPGQEITADDDPQLLRDLRIETACLLELIPTSVSTVATWVQDRDGHTLGPGMVWTTNDLGGRVVLVADEGIRGGILQRTYLNAVWQRLWFAPRICWRSTSNARPMVGG